ncbi:MAG: rRNA maturation RNase YbeY [Crocinitomicaceae bacterium]|nr:rRNA maturation RNase YbeY [Crocinitomicaceae bacterium]
MIEIEMINIEVPEFNPEFFVLALSKTIQEEGFLLGDITVIFVTDGYLLEMNKKHLNHDYYTDIITFDYCEGNIISGDLFISLDRVRENASIFDTPFLLELKRVMIHGVLHLCGHKDKTKEEEENMRSLENKYLN